MNSSEEIKLSLVTHYKIRLAHKLYEVKQNGFKEQHPPQHFHYSAYNRTCYVVYSCKYVVTKDLKNSEGFLSSKVPDSFDSICRILGPYLSSNVRPSICRGVHPHHGL